MRFDPHHEVQIPRRRVTVASASLPGQPDSLVVQDAGWNVDVILPSVQSESAFSALIEKGCECVGYQAHDPQGHEDAAMTMNRLVDSVRFTGHIGVVGIFLPQDQNGPDELERNGKINTDALPQRHHDVFGNTPIRKQPKRTTKISRLQQYSAHRNRSSHRSDANPAWTYEPSVRRVVAKEWCTSIIIDGVENSSATRRDVVRKSYSARSQEYTDLFGSMDSTHVSDRAW